MKYIPWIFGLIIILGLAGSLYIAGSNNIDVLSPIGEIGRQQKDLFYFAVLLSLLVVIPVFIMAIFISVKYRKTNKHAYYAPEWDRDKNAEALWWGVPVLLIFVLSIVTWNTTHSLDPYKPLAEPEVSIEIQVVALEWKWLFIYPQYDIATVNELTLPKDVPINFTLTADAPMNSFWVPSLGSQIYVMNGMKSRLHLVSNQLGSVVGRSANISGQGFSKMTFKANTLAKDDFKNWTNHVKKDGFTLGIYRYEQLAKPSVHDSPVYYSNIEPNLFNLVVDKYMSHGSH